MIMIDDNYKDHLMRHCQVNNWELPEYRVSGHHEGVFYIDIYVQDAFFARGIAKSKKQAEQNGARSYFEALSTYSNYDFT
jgi:ribonuclease-3